MHLRQFLNEITMCPGKFERKIRPLIDTLNSSVDDDDTMRAVVNTIFDEVIILCIITVQAKIDIICC